MEPGGGHMIRVAPTLSAMQQLLLHLVVAVVGVITGMVTGVMDCRRQKQPVKCRICVLFECVRSEPFSNVICRRILRPGACRRCCSCRRYWIWHRRWWNTSRHSRHTMRLVRRLARRGAAPPSSSPASAATASRTRACRRHRAAPHAGSVATGMIPSKAICARTPHHG